MKEIKGDLWELYGKGNTIVIPTNMRTDRLGCAIMGAGIALEAKKKCKGISTIYGAHLAVNPREILSLNNHMIMFPTKIKPKDDSDLYVIKNSAEQLQKLGEQWGRFEQNSKLDIKRIYLPRVGCGCGRLDWNIVREVLKPILDDRFIVVNL